MSRPTSYAPSSVRCASSSTFERISTEPDRWTWTSVSHRKPRTESPRTRGADMRYVRGVCRKRVAGLSGRWSWNRRQG